jgi:hypothetical protein
MPKPWYAQARDISVIMDLDSLMITETVPAFVPAPTPPTSR